MIIFSKPPDPESLWEKPKNQRSDGRLKKTADGYAWSGARLFDQFDHTPRDQIRFRRFLQVAVNDVPCFRESGGVELIAAAFNHHVVKASANIGWLKINNTNSRMS